MNLMRRGSTPLLLIGTATAALLAAGCSASGESPGSTAGSPSSADVRSTDGAASSADFPVVIEHALGETVIEEQPTRVAAVAWGDHEVPLALGVVPVGMSAAAWGDDDGDGVLPWVEERLDDLDAETPVLFDETDGIDIEAVAATEPDVILAAYSGLTQEEYDTLSRIAPVVAYPEVAWGTSMEDMIRLDSQALGLAAEGEELIAELDEEIAEEVADRPALLGTDVLVGYIDPTDLSQIGYYTTHDTRPGFLESIGMGVPQTVSDFSAGSDAFYTTISAERADQLDDVDLMVVYGQTDGSTLRELQADPLLGQIPAIRDGAVAVLQDSTPLAAAANPSPLSVDAMLEDYLDVLDAAIAAGGQGGSALSGTASPDA